MISVTYRGSFVKSKPPLSTGLKNWSACAWVVGQLLGEHPLWPFEGLSKRLYRPAWNACTWPFFAAMQIGVGLLTVDGGGRLLGGYAVHRTSFQQRAPGLHAGVIFVPHVS